MTEGTASPPQAADDFLDLGVYGAPPSDEPPPYATAPEQPARRRLPAAAGPVMWLVGGVAAGAVIVTAWHSSGSSTPTGPAGNAAATSQLPGGQLPGAGQLPNGQLPGGTQGQGPGGFGGFGGRAGEQHLLGTVTSVGSSTLTVKTATGTTTYPISTTTQIVKNGQLATLGSLTTGDTVLLHVYPLNGKTFVERVIDGGNRDGGSGGSDGQTGTDT